jgi:hypothetical protein
MGAVHNAVLLIVVVLIIDLVNSLLITSSN